MRLELLGYDTMHLPIGYLNYGSFSATFKAAITRQMMRSIDKMPALRADVRRSFTLKGRANAKRNKISILELK